MLYLQSKAEKEFDLRKEELKMKKEEMELQKELLLEAAQKQASATENMVKMLEHSDTTGKCAAADVATATAIPNDDVAAVAVFFVCNRKAV